MAYLLMLNDMRNSNIENLQAVRWSMNRQELVDFHNSERVDGYRDGHWGKAFRQGGPLEWFNPGVMDEDNAYWGGIYVIPDEVPEAEALAARFTKA